MQPSQLAINSISTRQKNLVEALDAYAAAGFYNVELVLPLLKSWLSEGHTIDDVQQLLAKHNLRCIGGSEDIVVCFGPLDRMQTNQALHLENATLLDQLGGGTLVIGTDGPEQPSLEALDTVVQVLRQVVRKIEGLNVRFALEFNWSPLIKSLKSAVLVCEKVNHPQLGVLFDPAHYHTTTTKFEHLIPESVRWIRHVHLDDMRDKPGELSNCNSDRVLPGEGILDLPALISILERCGYNGYYSIEMFNEDLWQLPASEAARRCYASLLPLCQPTPKL